MFAGGSSEGQASTLGGARLAGSKTNAKSKPLSPIALIPTSPNGSADAASRRRTEPASQASVLSSMRRSAGGPRELFVRGGDANVGPSGVMRHPRRMLEPDWDYVDPAPVPSWECQGPWEPVDTWLQTPAESNSYAPLCQDLMMPEAEAPQEDWGRTLLQSVPFQSFMAALIVANAIVIGVETDHSELQVWDTVENLFLFAFGGELLMKMSVFKPSAYFDINGGDFVWNVFDFMIVFLGGVDFVMGLLLGSTSAGSIATLFRIVRLLRILRIFRIVKFLKQLYMLAFGFACAAIAVLWVTFLMFFVLYVCSIVLVRTVGRPSEDDPQSELLTHKFGSILRAMLTLFEIMSSPNLNEYEDIMWERPAFALFVIVFIIFGSFGMIALLTGVISESMFDKNNLRMEEERLEREKTRKMLVKTCKRLFDALPSQIQDDSREEGAYTAEVMELLPQIAALFEQEGVDYALEDLYGMLDIIDASGSGKVKADEFKFFIVQMAEGVRPLLIMRLFYMMKTLRRQSYDCEAALTMLTKQNAENRSSVANTVQARILEEIGAISRRMEFQNASVDGLSERVGRVSETLAQVTQRVDHISTDVKCLRSGSTTDLSAIGRDGQSNGNIWSKVSRSFSAKSLSRDSP